MGEAGLNDALRVHLFSLSLIGTAFSWFSSLAPGSILNWNQLERKFHDHFYSGEAEVRLLDLTSIKQTRDETVLDYFQRFKALKNRCFNSSLSEKDLADLAFNGLRSYLKEKLEGFDYITVNHLQMRAIGTEFKYKNLKDTFKPHRSNTHVLDPDSDGSDDDSKEVYAAEFVWPSKAIPGSVPSLKPIQKNRQEELKFTFDVSKCDQIFDELLKNCNIRLSLYHLPRSLNDIHIVSGITLHLMLLMIVMFSVDRYNRPLMKYDWYFLRCKLTKFISLFIRWN